MSRHHINVTETTTWQYVIELPPEKEAEICGPGFPSAEGRAELTQWTQEYHDSDGMALFPKELTVVSRTMIKSPAKARWAMAYGRGTATNRESESGQTPTADIPGSATTDYVKE